MDDLRRISRYPALVFVFIGLVFCSCHKNSTGGHAVAEEGLTAELVSPSMNSIALQGQAVTFTGSAANGSEPYQYAWSLDEGKNIYATGNMLTLPFDVPGTYKVTLIVTDALSATAGITATVQVVVPERMESSLISAGTSHTLTIVSGSSLRAWGFNSYGQLGNGGWTDQHLPVKPLTDESFAGVSAFDMNSIALNSDGTIWSWGNTYIPQYYTWDKLNKPAMIDSEQDWRSISAGGFNYLMAVKNDNSLWKMDSSGVMIKVNTEKNWQLVSNGLTHACAVKTDGTLYAWGNNAYGQLGVEGFAFGTSVPQKVNLAKACLGASSGGKHTLAVLSDGTLWAWGDNSFGQLGNETNSSSSVPIQVGKDEDWIAVSAGLHHSLALKSDGTLCAWGDNYFGQLGDGTFKASNKPVPVNSDIPWVAFSSRYNHAIAMKHVGTYWALGSNGTGQLGICSVNDAGIPVMIRF